MATATATATIGSGKKKGPNLGSKESEFYAKLSKLFQIPPTWYKTKDGRKILLQHRVGKSSGAYTREEIAAKIGIDTEFAKDCAYANKVMKDTEALRSHTESLAKRYSSTQRHVVKAYRKSLAAFYDGQGLIPRFAQVPSATGKAILYVQGLVDKKTLVPVIGDVEDIVAWTCTEAQRSKNGHDRFVAAQGQSDALLKLPGINPDLKGLLTDVSEGNVTANLGFKINKKDDEKKS